MEDDTLNVIFTIDVESSRGNIPCRIEGDLSEFGISENCGMDYIMDTFAAYDANAVCFVNIYEHRLYDREYMPSLLRRINKRGNEVALHAHTPPEGGEIPAYPKCIADCSLEEQKKILAYGRDYIFQAIGKKPISYRSGAYWTNDSIFDALYDTGFLVDSSLYYSHKNNRFKQYADRKNSNFCTHGIIEFPIVVIWNGEGWRKLDLDSLTEEELIDSFEIMRKSSMYKTVQCMFHSYSFLDYIGSGGDAPLLDLNHGKENHFAIYGENKKTKQKLENVLGFLRSSGKYRILTFEQYMKADMKEIYNYSEDGLLYLKHQDLAIEYSDIDILYEGNNLFLMNKFQADGLQYAWRISPVGGKGPEYGYYYQPAPASRIALEMKANGKYNITAYIRGRNGERISVTFYQAVVSHGRIISVNRR